MKKSTDNLRYLSTKTAWMSFVAGQTQSQIARELEMSQSKVHRLINHALERGYVTIRIEGGSEELLDLENRLKQTFGLARCTVASAGMSGRDDHEALLQSVGEAAGHYLSQLLEKKAIMQIGVGMGETMSAAVAAMHTAQRADLKIVSITGSLLRKLSANPLDVVMRMQRKTGGEAYFLPVPYLASSVAERESFQSYQSVQELMELARQSDIFVVGIGSIDAESNLARTQEISAQELDDLRDAGVVGDIAGSFYDINGRIVETELGRKTVGMRGQELAGRRVLGMAAGLRKTQAVLGVLRSGLIHEIVLDEHLARAVLSEAPVGFGGTT
ncbi:sugar-binding transcriptional regulator [Ruegeria hyattellae]|uniref:sugar-binding transcriptional regulator n=1 Tax=Ruegeria hyattellae TaxID=3233337 RepID=UPI00355B8BD6